MRETLKRMIDRPIIVRTLPDDPNWKPLHGVVFAVHEDAVDLLLAPSVMRTVRFAMIVDVALDAPAARRLALEDPPDHPDYPVAKRELFEAEQAIYLEQPAETALAHARRAVELLHAVRLRHPGHLGCEQLLERAHFLATGRYDYEVEPQVTGGDVPNHHYQRAKEIAAALDQALKLKRPEQEMAGHLLAIARSAGRALAKYPAHAELKAWFEKAEAIRSKLSDEVRRSNGIADSFLPGKL